MACVFERYEKLNNFKKKSEKKLINSAPWEVHTTTDVFLNVTFVKQLNNNFHGRTNFLSSIEIEVARKKKNAIKVEPFSC